MNKNTIRKIMIVGIIILFAGSGFILSISGGIDNFVSVKDLEANIISSDTNTVTSESDIDISKTTQFSLADDTNNYQLDEKLNEECAGLIATGTCVKDNRSIFWKNRHWSNTTPNRVYFFGTGRYDYYGIGMPGANCQMGINEVGLACGSFTANRPGYINNWTKESDRTGGYTLTCRRFVLANFNNTKDAAYYFAQHADRSLNNGSNIGIVSREQGVGAVVSIFNQTGTVYTNITWINNTWAAIDNGLFCEGLGNDWDHNGETIKAMWDWITATNSTNSSDGDDKVTWQDVCHWGAKNVYGQENGTGLINTTHNISRNTSVSAFIAVCGNDSYNGSANTAWVQLGRQALVGVFLPLGASYLDYETDIPDEFTATGGMEGYMAPKVFYATNGTRFEGFESQLYHCNRTREILHYTNNNENRTFDEYEELMDTIMTSADDAEAQSRLEKFADESMEVALFYYVKNVTYGPVYNVDKNYTYNSIQEAINDADPGNTIKVIHNITRYENVIINKSIHLIGKNKDATIIDGIGTGNTIQITADYVTVKNFTIQNGGYSGYAGICVNSNNCNITNNNIVNNDHNGIDLYGSNNTVIDNNISDNYWFGISISGSSNNSIIRNIITGSAHGVDLRSSSNNNTLIGNNITFNKDEGIFLFDSFYNNISDNNITKTDGDGILMYPDSYYNNISDNNITNNEGNGIKMLGSSNNYCRENNISSNTVDGINLSSSSDNTIIQNNITNNSFGIYVGGSSDNTITSNCVNDNNYGIKVSSSSYTEIIGNTIINNQDPMLLLSSSDNTSVSNNNFLEGIIIDKSPDTTINGNTFLMNGINILGETLPYWNTHTIINNYIGSRQIYYYKNINSITVPIDAIQVILANCNYFILQDLNLSFVIDGLQLAYSSFNIINGSKFTNNTGYGIQVFNSDNNTFTENNISDNYIGISFNMLSADNTIIHNNFKNNNQHANDDNTTNEWNERYLIYGNYWDDYTGSDLKHGPLQDRIGPDLIGDDSYDVPGLAGNQDLYPLMNPWNGTLPVAPQSIVVYVDDDFNETVIEWGWQYDYFDKIQDGIDHVSENGTVYVWNGNYNETCTILKTLSLRGNGSTYTIINGTSSGQLIHIISSDLVNVSGFTLQNGATGIWIENSNGNNICDNYITKMSFRGVELYQSNHCNITQNTIESGSFSQGFYLTSCDDNNLTKNSVDGSIEQGFYLSSCDYNDLYDNLASHNKIGLHLFDCHHNTFVKNNVSYNTESGYHLVQSTYNTYINNTAEDESVFRDQDYGFYLTQSSNNTFRNNTAFRNEHYGFYLQSSVDNDIIGNNATNNQHAIYLYYHSDRNNISENTLYKNIYGSIYLSYFSQNNNITRNHLRSVGYQGYGINITYLSDKNDIINNTIDTSGTGSVFPYHAIHINQSDDITIINNTIHSGWYSIIHNGILLEFCHNINISNNEIYYNNQGISIASNVHDVKVYDNDIHHNFRGINLGSNCYDNNISKNEFLSNSYGLYITPSSNNEIYKNTFDYHDEYAFYIKSTSSANPIIWNTIYSGNNNGLCIDSSTTQTIKNNTFYGTGITIKGDLFSHWRTHIIADNTANGGEIAYYVDSSSMAIPQYGKQQIILANCDNITLQDYTITTCVDIPIQLGFSPYISISNCTIYNNDYGISLKQSTYASITDGNDIQGNAFDGIYLIDTSDYTNISNNTIISNNGRYGIYVNHSNNNKISENMIRDNGEHGIHMEWSDINHIQNNTFLDNFVRAIFISHAHENYIFDNNINWTYSQPCGIRIEYSDVHFISGNNISTNIGAEGVGIRLYHSHHNVIDSENHIYDNQYGIHLNHSFFNIIQNNTIHYNEDGIRITDFESIDNDIFENTIYENSNGIHILNNQGATTISKNIITDNGEGVMMRNTQLNNISKNNISNNDEGILICNAHSNKFFKNTIANNNPYPSSSFNGITITDDSSYNIIYENDIINNSFYGIKIDGEWCDNNFIYHNNFNNTKYNGYNAHDSSSTNIWNDTYPSGGNYWDNYTGVDINGDGIGDTPYNIPGNGNNQDDYPFMKPNGWFRGANWYLDVGKITGDQNCTGVEFDSTNYWVTGASDFTIAYLYEITPEGTLVNQFTQPAGNWGTWGWRDLAWDGQYLYAGDDGSNPNNITQINTINGEPTGISYGPYPVNPCGALVYDSMTDSFWTAYNQSNIYHCFKNGTYDNYTNPGLSIYGMAMDESDPSEPMLWIWSQDGNGCLASEFNPQTGTFTGNNFEGDSRIGGLAGGACAYITGRGVMEFVGMHMSTSDTIAGYINQPPYTPGNPNPADGAIDIDILADLSWSGGDPNLDDTLTYEIYLGTDPDLPYVDTIGPYPATETLIIYDPEILNYETTYYWKIVAKDNHGASTLGPIWSFTTGSANLGSFRWLMDVQTITGDSNCIGVEFDGTNYWITGSSEYTIPMLYEVSPEGVLIAAYAQPAENWETPGWRDLAWDGQYLYAGSIANPGNITQIDTSNGQPTGVEYGPYPVSLCLALAYETLTDTFWTAIYQSQIFQCYKDGMWEDVENPGLTIYGLAMEESIMEEPKLWIWSRDGQTGCLATEFDTRTRLYTGMFFEGNASIDGLAGGACAYGVYNGIWELVGMHMTTSDTIAAYYLTTGNQPPYTPSNPNPEDGATDIEINIYLNWSGGDPDPDNEVYYDIFFGTDPNPPYITKIGPYPWNQTEITWNPGTLENGTTYYWHIIAMDNQSGIAYGPIWNFTTQQGSRPPLTPTLVGPTQGYIGIEYTFSGNTTDPDNDQIYYNFSWGDNTSSSWLGPYGSGEPCEASHIWTQPNSYNVTLKAKDVHGVESNWSAPFLIFIESPWISPEVVSTESNESSYSSFLVIASNGTIHVAWVDQTDYNDSGTDSDIFYKYKPVGGNWSVTEVVSSESTEHVESPCLAVDNSGNVHVVWSDMTYYGVPGWINILYKMKSAGGAWTAAEVVTTESTGGAFHPSIDINSSGTVHVTWHDESNYGGSGSDRDIFYKTKPNGESWTITEVVSTESTLDSYDPSLAIDPTGMVHIAWYDPTNYEGSGNDLDIFYKMKPNGESWTITEVVSTESTTHSWDPSLDVDSNGTAHIAWSDETNYAGSGGDRDIFYKMKPSGGSWTLTEIVSTESTQTSYPPSLVVYFTGTVHVVWHDYPSFDIFYRYKEIQQNWSITEVVSEGLSGSSFPCLNIGNDSSVHVTWDAISNYGGSGSDRDIFYRMKLALVNQPPYPPRNPNPENGAINVEINSDLNWSGGDPDPGDTVTYDVYFGTESTPPKVVSNQSSNVYSPGTLNYSTTYYWQIISWDVYDAFAEGPIWHFTTETETNYPPTTPDINGPTQGKAGIEYNYTFVSTDPNDDDVSYWILWGDGNPGEWHGPFPSGEEIIRSHTFETQGSYTISAKAKDIHEAESGWGYLEVEMPVDSVFVDSQHINHLNFIRKLLF